MSTRRTRNRHHGMSLIEALLAISISATLLVALGAAFHASAGAVKTNDAYFRSTQSARLALNQILTEVRRADAVQLDPTGQTLQIIRPSDQLTPGEIDREYTYDPLQKRITLRILHADKSDDKIIELASNVTACKFTSATSASSPCISLSLTCAQDGASATLAGSATPRR